MSSWFRPGLFKPAEAKAKTYFYQTTDDNPADQFLDIFYCYLYARKQGRKLTVYDQSNPKMPLEGFFSSCFETIPGLEFIDVREPNSTSIAKTEKVVLPYINSLKVEELKKEADSFFQLKKGRVMEVLQLCARLPIKKTTKTGATAVSAPYQPDLYNVGLYIPLTEKGGVPALAGYFQALHALQRKHKLESLHIFYMAENEAILAELKKGMHESWTIYSASQPVIPISSSARVRMRSRMEEYMQFVAEISMLQTLAFAVYPLSSAVGKFLHLTSGEDTVAQTVDGSTFSAYIGF